MIHFIFLDLSKIFSFQHISSINQSMGYCTGLVFLYCLPNLVYILYLQHTSIQMLNFNEKNLIYI